MKENSNGSFDCFRKFIIISNWGWHGMASFAERGLISHPAKKKQNLRIEIFEFRNISKLLKILLICKKRLVSKPFKNLKLPLRNANGIRTFQICC